MSIGFYEVTNQSNDFPISNNLGYHYSRNNSYVYDLTTKEVIVPNVDYIVPTKGNDSITVFQRQNKRGYINANTGEVIVEPQYEAAWIFRSGVGAVVENDSVHFIGLDGKPINNKRFPYLKGEEYIYIGNFCPIRIGDKYGAIDKHGEWVLQPTWDFVESTPKGLLTAWRNGQQFYANRKDNIRLLPESFTYYGTDTLISCTDSIHIYVRQRQLEE